MADCTTLDQILVVGVVLVLTMAMFTLSVLAVTMLRSLWNER